MQASVATRPVWELKNPGPKKQKTWMAGSSSAMTIRIVACESFPLKIHRDEPSLKFGGYDLVQQYQHLNCSHFRTRPRFDTSAASRSNRGRHHEGAPDSGARAVPAGGTTHSAPGRPWEDARPALRPVYEKLVRLGQAETDNTRLLAKSQEARPGTERWRSFAYARAAAERR
jgi:hypothetical protein